MKVGSCYVIPVKISNGVSFRDLNCNRSVDVMEYRDPITREVRYMVQGNRGLLELLVGRY